jgi:ERCC4-type nuclease
LIFVTDNEFRSRIPDILDKLGIKYAEKHLDVFDYFVGSEDENGWNGIGIERKSSEDYVSSLVSGHLDQQLYNMSYLSDLSYLIIIGDITSALLFRKVNREVVISSLVGASLKKADSGKRGQVITVNLENDYDFVSFLKHLDAKVSQIENRIPIIKKRGDYTDIKLKVVMSFPGIGEKTAKNILRKFKTINSFASSEVDDLCKVDNIGRKKAEQIYKILNDEYNENNK